MRRAAFASLLMLAGALPGHAQETDDVTPPQQPTVADRPVNSPVISPVLTIDSERMFRESAFGRRVTADIEARSVDLAAENREIEAELEAEERALTEQRAEMTPEAFRSRADAFDAKVQRTRAEQAAKNRALTDRLEEERERFLNAAAPVLEQLMRNSGAAVILERRRVFVSSAAVEVTDRAITLLDQTIGSGLGDQSD